MSTSIHPIEAESYRILAERVDLDHYDERCRPVVARVIHASADQTYAGTMVLDPAAVDAGVEALRSGAPVFCDVQMVCAGITGVETNCLLNDVVAGPGGQPTRSARAMTLAAERAPEGAVFVVGCAPTALFEIVRLVSVGILHPSLVIGMPVGFVGASDAKEALRALASAPPAGRPIHAISNRGEHGGSAVAAAACNALIRLARTDAPTERPPTTRADEEQT